MQINEEATIDMDILSKIIVEIAHSIE